MARKSGVAGKVFKAKVALAALKEDKSLSELASQFDVHPTQIGRWRQRLLAGAAELFEDGRRGGASEEEVSRDELYAQIGRLQMEVEWLKKKLPASIAELRGLLEPAHAELSIRRQCELLGLNRSSWYYEPVPESAENLRLMRLLDEQYLKTPFFGSRRLALMLRRQGHEVNRKRVQRLMRRMGIEAIYPKPRTTRRGPAARIYPYLLRDLTITRPDQVWAADITYVPMRQGFLYLVAILDWFSRYVVSWRLSNSLEGSFCCECLEEALACRRPEIFNTDQGVQFTSEGFTSRLLASSVAISMDGRGRALDNVFVERLWRTVKYEEVYLKEYPTALDAESNLAEYFWFYGNERPHSALANQTPAEVYYAGRRRPRK